MKNNQLKHIVLMLLITGFVFTACNKDEINEPEDNQENEDTAVTSNDYYPITVGSYWVYEFDSHSSNGTITENVGIDTLKVIGDTVIDGENYYVFHTNHPNNNMTYYRRIDNGEVLSSSGALVCPPDNSYSGVYNEYYSVAGTDTLFHYWEEFSGYHSVNTSFGETYACIQKTAFRQYSPSQGGQLTADTMYYSPIGVLQRSDSYFSGGKFVGTLIDYHLE